MRTSNPAELSIRALSLPPRVERILSNRGITTAGMLASYSAAELMLMPGIGPVALVRIGLALKREGLYLRES